MYKKKIGRKDVNGKEIYEGDIIKICRTSYTKCGIIEMTDNSHGRKLGWDVVKQKDGDSIDYYYGFSSWSSCEVIGNVFETRDIVELLKATIK